MLQYTLSEQLRYVIVDYVIMLCIYICCVTCNKISSVILYTRVVVLYIYILKHFTLTLSEGGAMKSVTERNKVANVSSCRC